MKLSVLLNSLIGKEVSGSDIANISSEVDAIKARATEKTKLELDKFKGDLKVANEKLNEYITAEKDGTFKDAFVKAGGDAEKFNSFKKVAGDIEDIEKIDFKEIFKEFKDLKKSKSESDRDTTEDDDFKSGDITQTHSNDDDDTSGDAEGSLLA